jgi:hypothetical protein
MNDMRSIIRQMSLPEARLWLAYCVAAGIVGFTIVPEDRAANA